MTSIIVDDANPNYRSPNNCNAIIDIANNTLICGCQNSIIPNSVTKIGEYAFNGCTGLTSIEIPDSVTEIGGFAFADCSDLLEIHIKHKEPDSCHLSQEDFLIYLPVKKLMI